ncbi:DUF3379 family protein [Photobacterium toruni]|uniref:DUF3379 family protein n=1 Tax=Photobacterium toruni TaxID=1935446 RepID=A0A1T4K9B5_9GAMM|nr:DUF3379 family protein [Photobacterium toruni]MEC6813980.1 DUF3379 family protein [Photobacterium toruni]MEC6832391.1 DUF3379 family protein [Photobacterium toruni]SJZ38903.1 hypothetical protein CZ814_00156 [Photobacterium toruni]
MDDLEFRRRLLANPNDNDPELVKTKNQSTTNRHFANELQQLDLKLKQTINVDIPENLADRILFHQSSQAQPKNHHPYKRYLSYGLAASVMFFVGVMVGQQQLSPQQPQSQVFTPTSMSAIALQHVNAEARFVEHTDEAVTLQQVNAKLKPFGTSMNQLPGHIYYLNYCGFDGNRALHMIVGTDKGKMTVFIVPQTSSQIATDSDNINQSLLLPLQDASLIVVGDKDDKLMPIAEKLKSELYWQI